MNIRTISVAVMLLLPAATSIAQTSRQPANPRSTRPSSPALDPAERGALLSRAAGALSQGRRDEAARLFRSAAERFGSVQALLQLARIQSGNGDAAGALASLNKARALAPNAEEVLTALAQVSLAARDPMPAVRTLQSLTRMCPTSAEYHHQLGVALMLTGDLAAAVEALERSEQLDPNSGLTLIALGLALNGRKLYAEARPFLARSLELEPDSIDALAALAEAEEGLGEIGPAETHARRAIEGKDTHPVANLVMGLLFMRQGRYDDAREALLRTVAADPSNPRAYYQLSLAYTRLGDDGSAKKYVDLYQQKLREAQERVRAIRGEARPGDRSER